MPRTRLIKHSFFLNDQLAEVGSLGRLLFIGLWTLADKEGRIEDRPKKLKAELLPYDECDIDSLLNDLAHFGFIIRYSNDKGNHIQIVNFTKHQRPHPNEPESDIPAFIEDTGESCKDMINHEKKLENIANCPLTSSSLPLSLSSLPSDSLPAEELMSDASRQTNEGSIAQVREVFDHWREKLNHPTAQFSNERKAKIRARLQTFTVDDLKLAIDGCRASPFHQGENPEGRIHDSIELIFRNVEKVEAFIGFAKNPPKPKENNGIIRTSSASVRGQSTPQSGSSRFGGTEF